jgi:hypothetical protein
MANLIRIGDHEHDCDQEEARQEGRPGEEGQEADVPATLKLHTAKQANTQPESRAKKLSQIAAAIEVLKTAAEPMTCKAMVESMTAKGLWSSPGGKTPEATLYASILREIATKGKAARFVKTARGLFAAKA